MRVGTLSVLLILSAGVKAGMKGSFHVGAVRDLSPDCSWSTHSSAACSLSRAKLVSSQTSLQHGTHGAVHEMFTSIPRYQNQSSDLEMPVEPTGA